MSGVARARRLGFFLAFFGASASGCAATSETRGERVVESDHRDLTRRPAPELSETTASASLSGSRLTLRVEREDQCWVSSQPITTVEVETRSSPRAGWVITGAALTVLGFASIRGSDEIQGLRLLGWGMVLVGTPMLIGSAASISHETHRERRAGAVTTEPARCALGRDRRHRVELVLADGRAIAGVTGPDGTLTLELPPDLGELDADLYVDGAPVRRVRLEREAPP